MEQVICSVCMERLFAEQFIVRSDCNHVFHEGCLRTWVQKCTQANSPPSCPECRAEIATTHVRMFFRMDTVRLNDSDLAHQEHLKQENLELRNALATQRRNFEEQLCSEQEIRHDLVKKLKQAQEKIQQLETVSNTTPASSNSTNNTAVPNQPGTSTSTPVASPKTPLLAPPKLLVEKWRVPIEPFEPSTRTPDASLIKIDDDDDENETDRSIDLSKVTFRARKDNQPKAVKRIVLESDKHEGSSKRLKNS